MRKFEHMNNDISLNVVGFEENQFFPLYISRKKGCCHQIDILYVKRGNDSLLVYQEFKPTSHENKICSPRTQFLYCLQGLQSSHTLDKLLTLRWAMYRSPTARHRWRFEVFGQTYTFSTKDGYLSTISDTFTYSIYHSFSTVRLWVLRSVDRWKI